MALLSAVFARYGGGPVLAARRLRPDWLVGDFGKEPATASEAYVARITGRPAFRKAQADQIALFEAADAKRRSAS